MVHFTATFVAKPGLEHRVEELCRGIVAPTAEESGCLVYELYRCQEEPRRFFYREIWRDEVSLEQHAARPRMARFLEQIDTLLERPSEFLTFDMLDSVERVRGR